MTEQAIVLKATSEAADEAVKSARSLLSDIRKSGNKAKEADALLGVSAALLGAGTASEAIKAAREAVSLFEEVGDKKGEAGAYIATAQANLADNNAETALAQAQRAVEILRAAEDRSGEASALLVVADAHAAKGDHSESLKVTDAARAIFRELGDVKSQAGALRAASGKHLENGQPEQAMQVAYEALTLIRKVQDKFEEALTSQTAAVAHLASLKKDLSELSESSEASDRVAITEGFDECIRVAEDTVEGFAAAGHVQKTGEAYITLCNVLMGRGSERAIDAADKAIMTFAGVDDYQGYFQALICSSKAHLMKGAPASALRAANAAKELCYHDMAALAMVETLIMDIKKFIYERQTMKKQRQLLSFPLLVERPVEAK